MDTSQPNQPKTESQPSQGQAPTEPPESRGTAERPKDKLDSVTVDRTFEELGRGIVIVGGVRPPSKRGT